MYEGEKYLDFQEEGQPEGDWLFSVLRWCCAVRQAGLTPFCFSFNVAKRFPNTISITSQREERKSGLGFQI